MNNDETRKEFADELLILCKKHGVSISYSPRFLIDQDDYELSIFSQWEVEDPIEIYRNKGIEEIK